MELAFVDDAQVPIEFHRFLTFLGSLEFFGLSLVLLRRWTGSQTEFLITVVQYTKRRRAHTMPVVKKSANAFGRTVIFIIG